MKIKPIYRFLMLIVLVALAATGCKNSKIVPGGGGGSSPVSWIDKPLNGSTFPLGPVEIITHSNDPAGVTSVEISANGKVIATLPASGAMAISKHSWTPSEEGNYILRVRSQGGSGWGDYAQVTITIGDGSVTLAPVVPVPLELPVCDISTPTPVCPPTVVPPAGWISPTPPVCGVPTLAPVAGAPTATMTFTPTLPGIITPTLPCITATPTLAGPSGDTPTPVGPTPVPGTGCEAAPVCVTATPTPAGPAGITYLPSISTSQFYYGGCSPNNITVQVEVRGAEDLFSVVMFQKLESPSNQGPWNEGTAMTPVGGGKFSLTIPGNSVPGRNDYELAYWVYQFVATNHKGEVIGRTQRFYNVFLAKCGQAPKAPEKPFVPVRPLPFKVITVPPADIPTPFGGWPK